MTPMLVHVTTTDMSLELLLGPQLRTFARSGFEVVTMSAPGPYVDGLERDGIRHIPLRHATRSMAPHHDLLAFRELLGHFRTLQPDIVHTHNPKPGIYGRFAARAAGVPAIVNTVHGLYAQPTDSWRRRALVYGLERRAARCSHAELVQNPEDIPVLERLGVASHKIFALGNGVDLDRFHPNVAWRDEARRELGIDPSTTVIGAVGRLVWEKGYRELLAAARTFAGRDDVAFVVVGGIDTAKADAVDQPAIDEAEAAGVRFLGHRHDVERLYHAMDIYVLASHREGFPRSAMEASACGVPIIATDIRGCRQVVDHQRTGLLVPVRDAAALANAIETLVADEQLRQRLGVAAARKARADFDQTRIIATTLATYERCLSDLPINTTAPARPVTPTATTVRPAVLGNEELSPA
jgi:glycosyltransferase involved in cell wall biosynthesis